MSFRGHIKNGFVVLDESVELPDGTEVRVDVVEQPPQPEENGRTLLDTLEPLRGKAQGLPEDAAANVDHYLYGQPKK